jgi:hypothetical protein
VGALGHAQQQTAAALVRAESAESARAAALVRVAELERSIEMLRAEDIVEDLVAFDEKIAHASGKHQKDEAKLA